MSRLVRAAAELGDPMEVPSEPPRPVFVVGMNGSGTSMLAECLGRHPALFTSRGETRVLPHLISLARRAGNLAEDGNFLALWEQVRSVHVFVRRNGGVPPPIPRNWADYPRSLASIVDASYRHFAAADGKERWCEKTPQYVQHMRELLALFPGCRFVHIIRDGRACVAWFHRGWQRSMRLSIYRWKKVIELAGEAAPGLGEHYLAIRYEDLVADAEVWMRRVCAHLDLPFTRDVLLSSQPQSDAAGRLSTIHGGNADRWRAQLDETELRRLEAIAGGCPERCGYPVLYERGNRNPNPVELGAWRAADRFRALCHLGAGLVRHRSPRRRRIGRRVLAGWRHARGNRY